MSTHWKPAKGRGRELPGYLDVLDAQARVGTAEVRRVDKELIVGRNRQTGTLEIWGPSQFYRQWMLLCEVETDDGREVSWLRVRKALIEARDGPLSTDIALEANRRIEEVQKKRAAECLRDAIAFMWGGIGTARTRVDAEDMGVAYKHQVEGVKPEAKGKKVSLPGKIWKPGDP